MSEERLDRVEQGMTKLVEDLRRSQDRRGGPEDRRRGPEDRRRPILKTDVVDLRRHMGVLHEEVVGRIKALGEDDSLRREMRAGFAEMRQLFLAHTVPGDAADRVFAATLNDHERRIQTLEQR